MSVALRLPAYQTLAEDLRKQITSGRLRPGDRLPTEPQLCASTGVSRSTVREALRLLASQHLIVTTRGVTGGSFVARPDPEKLIEILATGLGLLLASAEVSGQDLLEVRSLLEVPGSRLAARKHTEADLGAIRVALDHPTGTIDEKIAAQHAFHRAVADASGNPLFRLLTRPLYGLGNETNVAGRADPQLWVRLHAEHIEILAAIEARDEDAAEATTVAHIAHLRQAYAQMAAAGP